jgi:hypothetical protein
MRGRMPISVILLCAGVVASLLLTRGGPIGSHAVAPHQERTSSGPSITPRAVEPPQMPSLPGPERDKYEAAERMVAEGNWRGAQDAYLKILLVNPDDVRAMQGLIAVQRRIAGEDAAALRHRADAYRRALGTGAETPEHYTQASLRLLYIANLMAAAQADAERMAKTPPPGAGAPAGRRTERIAPQPAAVLTGPGRTRTAGTASPAERPAGSHTIPAQAMPQLQPYRAPARVIPPSPVHPGVAPPSPAPARPGPAGPTVPVQTVALERPSGVRSAGTLRMVDCGNEMLGIETGGGLRTFAVTPRTIIYAGMDKLAQFCALKGFVGTRAVVWGTVVGARHTAQRVNVAAVSAYSPSAPRVHQEGGVGRVALVPAPVPGSSAASQNATGDPSWKGGSGVYTEETDRVGIITAKISDAALVVSRGGAVAIAITPGTKVVGLRSAFGAISRFDVVRVRGRSTASGSVIAEVIEVTLIPSGAQLQQLASEFAYASVTDMARRIGGVATVSGAGRLTGNGLEVGANGGVSTGGASVSGGASVGSGGASVSAGASVAAGSTGKGGGVSVGGGTVGAGGVSVGGGSGGSSAAGGDAGGGGKR